MEPANSLFAQVKLALDQLKDLDNDCYNPFKNLKYLDYFSKEIRVFCSAEHNYVIARDDCQISSMLYLVIIYDVNSNQMKHDEVTNHSLKELVEQIVPILEKFVETEEFMFSIENLETNIQSLELRVQRIQKEINILIKVK